MTTPRNPISLQVYICVCCHAVHVTSQFWSSAELSLAELSLALETALAQHVVDVTGISAIARNSTNAHTVSLQDGSALLFVLDSLAQSSASRLNLRLQWFIHHIPLSFCLRYAHHLCDRWQFIAAGKPRRARAHPQETQSRREERCLLHATASGGQMASLPGQAGKA